MGERFEQVTVERLIHRAQESAAFGELRKLRVHLGFGGAKVAPYATALHEPIAPVVQVHALWQVLVGLSTTPHSCSGSPNGRCVCPMIPTKNGTAHATILGNRGLYASFSAKPLPYYRWRNMPASLATLEDSF